MPSQPPPPMPIPDYSRGAGPHRAPEEKVGGHRWLIGALVGCGVLALASLGVVGYIGYRAWQGAMTSFSGQLQLAPPTPPGQGCFQEVARFRAPDDVVCLAAGNVDADPMIDTVAMAGPDLLLFEQTGAQDAQIPSGLKSVPTPTWGGGIYSFGQVDLEVATFLGRPVIVVASMMDPHVFAYDVQVAPAAVFHDTVANTRVTCLGVGDLDGDREDEILVGRDSQLGLTCFDSAGNTKWKYGSMIDPSFVTVADTSGDGKPEVYVGSPGGQVEVLDANGRQVGRWTPTRLDTSITAADLDHNGADELVGIGSSLGQPSAGPGGGGPGFQSLFALSLVGIAPDGSQLWSQQLSTGVAYLTPASVVAGDLDADGKGEWIASATDGTVRVFDIDGNELDRYAMGQHIYALAIAPPGKSGDKPRLWVSIGQDVVGLEWHQWTSAPMPADPGDDDSDDGA
jgi:hypothetical protein